VPVWPLPASLLDVRAAPERRASSDCSARSPRPSSTCQACRRRCCERSTHAGQALKHARNSPPRTNRHGGSGQAVPGRLAAWPPVFESFNTILGAAIFDRLYQSDWRTHQADAVRQVCADGKVDAHVVLADDRSIAGFIALLRREPATGVVDMIAVHPDFQRRGYARALMQFAIQSFRDQGLSMINVDTGGDPGHAPARALYEAVGFTGLPVVSYYLAAEPTSG